MVSFAAMSTRHIVALGGGGFLMETERSALDDYVLAQASAGSRGLPRVCFVATASGDSVAAIEKFYAAFTPERARASHLALFRMETKRDSIAEQLLAQDVIYVGGGNTANMLAVWRIHGVDRALRRAWNAGIVLAGVSAGMICWFEDGVTDSFGRPLRALGDGLGFLKGSACPHYDGESDRRAAFHAMARGKTRGGRARGGWAADDGCALHFMGTRLHAVVSSKRRPGAYRVERGDRGVVETRIEPRVLRG